MNTTTSNNTTGRIGYNLTASEAIQQGIDWLLSYAKPCSAQDMAHLLEVAKQSYVRRELEVTAQRDELLAALKGLVTRCKDGWIPPEFQGDEFELGWLQACTEFARCKALLVAQAAIAKAEGSEK